MPYLTRSADITAYIDRLSQTTSQTTSQPAILWLDTEIADCWTPNPKLSLIQVLGDPDDRTGDQAYVLDLLGREDLQAQFVEKIMINPQIEKVFHNASFDVKYLGGKDRVKRVTCTYALARKNKASLSQCPNLKLKTLAVTLCDFDSQLVQQLLNEQLSDWGQRPLSEKQLWYAQMDVVYLAQVHQRLQVLCKVSPPPFGQASIRSQGLGGPDSGKQGLGRTGSARSGVSRQGRNR
jgi:ribonuclease D